MRYDTNHEQYNAYGKHCACQCMMRTARIQVATREISFTIREIFFYAPRLFTIRSMVRTVFSASARISKGQGYQVFLRKTAGSSFGQKRAICVVQEKTWIMDRISLLFGVNKMPLVAEWCGALLKMPSRSTSISSGQNLIVLQASCANVSWGMLYVFRAMSAIRCPCISLPFY
jgi:hypothetical protein